MILILIFKILIIFVFVLILISLVSGFTFLIKDQGKTTRTVKSLTVRVALSVSLFVLLMIGFATGLIKPHGVVPPARVVESQPK